MNSHRASPELEPVGASDSSASQHDSQFFEIPITLPDGYFVAHIQEPATTSVTQLLRRLRSGRYAKPFVLADREYRQLHFDLRFMQSRMSLQYPDTLVLAYTRKMMAFLLFNPRPRDIVIIGLGGGSLTKFCYRQFPRARITTVEIDQAVIDLSHFFEVPVPDERLHIVCADGSRYFEATGHSADVILVDGCDQRGIAPALCEERFYQGIHKHLRPGGVLVVNLVGTLGRSAEAVRNIAHVFGDQMLVLPVSVGRNRIVVALRNAAKPLDWCAIKQLAARLTEQHELDFLSFAEQLELTDRTAYAKKSSRRSPTFRHLPR